MISNFSERFEFYHLGQVEPAPGALGFFDTHEDLIGALFAFMGGSRGWIWVLFDPALDSSIYIELGNTLASRYADELARVTAEDVWITPPQMVNAEQAQSQIQHARAGGGEYKRLDYLHRYNDHVVPVRMVVVHTPSEEAAHA